MSTLFKITEVGIAAAVSMYPTGPLLEIASFKVGSSHGYTPSVGSNPDVSNETALHGTIRYSGAISNYQVEDNDTVSVTLVMDESVGDFTYGEIGLYLNDVDETLFAIGTWEDLQTKHVSIGNQVGDRIIIKAKLRLVGIAAVLNFPIVTPGTGLPEVPLFSTLDPSDPEANAYSVQWGDGCGNNGLALWNSTDELWGFPTHVTHFEGTVTDATTTTVTGSEPDLLNVQEVAAGRFIVQFLDGPFKGYVREITDSNGLGQVTFSPALPSAPGVGVNYRIHVSNCYWLEQSVGIYWAGTYDYNSLATRVNVITGAPNGNVANTNKGYGEEHLPILSVLQRVTPSHWENLYNRVRNGRKHQGAVPATIDANLPTWDFFFRNNNGYGYGLVDYQEAYSTLRQAITDLETNKDERAIDTIEVLHPGGPGRAIRQTTWAGTISHQAVLTFNNANHAYQWFNSGCRVGMKPALREALDADDLAWELLLDSVTQVMLAANQSYKGVGVFTIVVPTGFYDIVVGDPPVTLVTATDGVRIYNLKVARPSAEVLQITSEFVSNVVGYGYSYGYGISWHGISNQFILERHDDTWLSEIPLPDVDYVLDGMMPSVAVGSPPAAGAPMPTNSRSFGVAGSYSFEVPPGVTSIHVELWGGGGGGGSGSFCGDAYSGGGGGSGGYTSGFLTVTPGETLTIVVGAGGAGGAYPGSCSGHNQGTSGGGTSVTGGSGALSATGGTGGQVPGFYPGAGVGGTGGLPAGVAGSNGQELDGLCVGGSGGQVGDVDYGRGGNGGCGDAGDDGNPGAVILSWMG